MSKCAVLAAVVFGLWCSAFAGPHGPPGGSTSNAISSAVYPTYGPCPVTCTGSACAGCTFSYSVKPDPDHPTKMEVCLTLVCNGHTVIDGCYQGIDPNRNEKIHEGQTPGCKVEVQPTSGSWGATTQCSDNTASCS